jgi:hypothetical protein
MVLLQVIAGRSRTMKELSKGEKELNDRIAERVQALDIKREDLVTEMLTLLRAHVQEELTYMKEMAREECVEMGEIDLKRLEGQVFLDIFQEVAVRTLDTANLIKVHDALKGRGLIIKDCQ